MPAFQSLLDCFCRGREYGSKFDPTFFGNLCLLSRALMTKIDMGRLGSISDADFVDGSNHIAADMPCT